MVFAGMRPKFFCSPALFKSMVISRLLLVCLWCGVRKGFARMRRHQLGQQLAEVRFLQHLELSGAIAGRIAPWVWRADEGTGSRLTVAEVDEVHGDDLVDDAGELAPGLLAFELDAPFAVVKFVNHLLEDGDE